MRLNSKTTLANKLGLRAKWWKHTNNQQISKSRNASIYAHMKIYPIAFVCVVRLIGVRARSHTQHTRHTHTPFIHPFAARIGWTGINYYNNCIKQNTFAPRSHSHTICRANTANDWTYINVRLSAALSCIMRHSRWLPITHALCKYNSVGT